MVYDKNCFVFVVGSLNALPILRETIDEISIILKRTRFCHEKMYVDVDCFHVIINKNDANRLLMSGFPGMLLGICGDLRTDNQLKIRIIAEEIIFVSSSENNHINEFITLNQPMEKNLNKNNVGLRFLH